LPESAASTCSSEFWKEEDWEANEKTPSFARKFEFLTKRTTHAAVGFGGKHRHDSVVGPAAMFTGGMLMWYMALTHSRQQ
jgi:hypothetical protein